MEKGMNRQEKELLEGYRQLRPESKRFIMATVITAFTKERAIKPATAGKSKATRKP